MRSRSMFKVMTIAIAIAVVGALAFGLCGCASTTQSSASRASNGSSASTETDTDQLYSEYIDGYTLYVVQKDDKAFDVITENTVDVPLDLIPDPDAYYKVVADVTLLNGGVAGYVDYPDVRNIISCEEISPDEVDLKK